MRFQKRSKGPHVYRCMRSDSENMARTLKYLQRSIVNLNTAGEITNGSSRTLRNPNRLDPGVKPG
jgi:hypothetical protein